LHSFCGRSIVGQLRRAAQELPNRPSIKATAPIVAASMAEGDSSNRLVDVQAILTFIDLVAGNEPSAMPEESDDKG